MDVTSRLERNDEIIMTRNKQAPSVLKCISNYDDFLLRLVNVCQSSAGPSLPMSQLLNSELAGGLGSPGSRRDTGQHRDDDCSPSSLSKGYSTSPHRLRTGA